MCTSQKPHLTTPYFSIRTDFLSHRILDEFPKANKETESTSSICSQFWLHGAEDR